MKIGDKQLLTYIQSVSGKQADETLQHFCDAFAQSLRHDTPTPTPTPTQPQPASSPSASSPEPAAASTPAPSTPSTPEPAVASVASDADADSADAASVDEAESSPEFQYRLVVQGKADDLQSGTVLRVLAPEEPEDDIPAGAHIVLFNPGECLRIAAQTVGVPSDPKERKLVARENKDRLLFIQSIAQDKDIPQEDIVGIFADALAQSLRRTSAGHLFPSGRAEPARHEGEFRVHIDATTGEMQVARLWRVIGDDELIENAQYEIMSDNEIAAVVKPDARPGDVIEWPLLNPSFDMRACFQVAKQALSVRIRDAERGRLLDELLDRGDDLVIGPVARMSRDQGDAIMEVMKVECRLPRREMLPRENIKVGDRVKALIKEVNRELRGPQVMVTRNSPQFLTRLFQREVPELEKGVLEIVNAVRDPGNRAKIAVRSSDIRVDPVGTCVGIRGSRVQNVTNELNGERIDIVHWDPDEVTYVLRALAPAEAIKVEVDNDNNCMNVLVEPEKLAQAIGRSGVNVRLAAELTGWRLNLKTPEEFSAEVEEETVRKSRILMEKLDVDENVARILFEEGFETLEHVAYAEPGELMEIEGFNEEMVGEIQNRAREVAEKEEGELAEKLAQMSDQLAELDGADEEFLRALAAAGILQLDELADLSISELREVADIDADRAGELIMRARDELEADEEERQRLLEQEGDDDGGSEAGAGVGGVGGVGGVEGGVDGVEGDSPESRPAA